MGLLPKIPNSVDAQIALRDLYETKYGIFDHLQAGKNKPLASVAMHPMEDGNPGSALEASMRQYADSNIKETFDMSFLEYIQQPIDVIKMLIEVSAEIQKANSDKLSGVQKDLDKALGKKP